MNSKERIYVALDVDHLDKAKELVKTLAPHVGGFKAGLELLTAEGAPKVVEAIHKWGGKLFFDGKFDDIPNTIASASRAVAHLGVHMFNVHASSGFDAMQAAVENKGNSILLAVTVLTSFNEAACRAVFGKSVREKVIEMAYEAKRAGVDGLVCSAQDLAFLNADVNLKSLLKVTPGIRPTWASRGDQSRVLTPLEAVHAGADYLVIGRPITAPPPEVGTSERAVELILEELPKETD